MARAEFEIEDAIIVNISCVYGEKIVTKFLRFCIDNDIYGWRMGSSGPTGVLKAFPAEHKEKIRAWLEENAEPLTRD